MGAVGVDGAFNVAYKSKYLTPPKAKWSVSIDIGKDDGSKDYKFMADTFLKLFNKQSADLIKQREKEFADAMKWTEERLSGKSPEEQEKVVDTANKLVKQGFTNVEQVELPRMADDCLAQAVKETEKKMKKKLALKQGKAIAKIIILSLIVLAVAAVSIAATVLTGGATAVVVIGAVVAGLGAIYKVYKTVDTNWRTHETALAKLDADVKAIQDAIKLRVKAEEKQRTYQELGKMEKIKLVLQGTEPLRQNLKKHIDEAETFLFPVKKSLEENMTKLTEMDEELVRLAEVPDKGISSECMALKVESGKVRAEILNASRQLDQFADVKNTGYQLLNDLDAYQVPDFKLLGVAAGKLRKAGPVIKGVGQSLIKIGKAAQKIQKAVAAA